MTNLPGGIVEGHRGHRDTNISLLTPNGMAAPVWEGAAGTSRKSRAWSGWDGGRVIPCRMGLFGDVSKPCPSVCISVIGPFSAAGLEKEINKAK